MTGILFDLSAAAGLAGRICARTGWTLGLVEQRNFPDGETYVRLATKVEKRDVILLSTLDRPEAKLLPLLFAAAAARSGGARSAGLIAPYLAYMRQDVAFREGEAVTSAVFADILSGGIDWLATLDPHLHRHHSLSDVYSVPAASASAAEVIGNWIRRQVTQPVLVGPDQESRQWIEAVAVAASAPSIVLRKNRLSSESVVVDSVALADLPGGTPIILDDIVSTAGTMIAAVNALKKYNRPPPICIAVHPVFAGDSYARLLDAGPLAVVSTNSIEHPTNEIDVSEALAGAAEKLIASAEPKQR